MDLPLKSEKTNELTEALVNAQLEYPNLSKDSQGHNYKHADIHAVMLAVRPSLNKYGISVDIYTSCDNGSLIGHVRLEHKTSGQFKESQFYVDADPNAPKSMSYHQARGAALTYETKYALRNLAGITCGDDPDDCDPDKRTAAQVQEYKENKAANPADKPTNISDKQLGYLRSLLISQPEKETKICNYYGITDLSLLPWRKMNEVVEKLKPKGE